MTDLAALLHDADAGATVATLATTHGLSPSRVYGILRRHRPDRTRAPRPRGSDKAILVAGLLSQGYAPARAAELARCSRAWVYRIAKGRTV